MNLGGAIRKERQRQEISQTRLAKEAGISSSYLSQIENNQKEPVPVILKTIASCLKISLPALLFLSLEESDIKPEKVSLFQELAPIFQNLIAT